MRLDAGALARHRGRLAGQPGALRRRVHGQYPYLERYLERPLSGAEVLEIGLGYGTLSGALMARGASYHGLDIAQGPVDMARHRWQLAGGEDGERRIVQGSALEVPFPDGELRRRVHDRLPAPHGDLPRAVAEVQRVLRPGGTAVVMLYNAYSFRQFLSAGLPARLRRRPEPVDRRGALRHEPRGRGGAAHGLRQPVQVRRLFAGFAAVEIEPRNFDGLGPIPRRLLLGTLDRLLGLDLYITARR